MYISIVSTIYNSANSIETLVKSIIQTVETTTPLYEIILIDDGSYDNSWNTIESLTQTIPNLIGIKLSRNFGQHYAISCGIEHAKGEWIIVMDGDLQDNPQEITRLLEKTNEGYKIITANRINRKDIFTKKLSSILFWKILSYLTGKKLHHTISNFGIYHKDVIQSINSMHDNIRFFPTMVNWVGFQKTTINVIHQARTEGKSTYTTKKMVRLAMDVILVNSEKPLKLVVKTGLLISFISFIIGNIYLYKFITHQILVPGYASIIISIWFLGGLIIFILGILGLYIGKTFDAVKNRPYYIIEKNTASTK